MIHRISGKPPVPESKAQREAGSQEAENLSTSDEARVTQPTTDLDENGIPAAGLPRARDLIANYLWNEDGESEDWLHEAHDILKAATEARADRPPEPPTLDARNFDKVRQVRVWDMKRRAMRIVCICGAEILVANWANHLRKTPDGKRHGVQFEPLAASPPPDLSELLLAEVGRVAVGLAADWMGDPDHGFILDRLVAPVEAYRAALGRATPEEPSE